MQRVEAGDSERTAVLVEDRLTWRTWCTWKSNDEGLQHQLERARARGNVRLREELLSCVDQVQAKVRMHLLACRDEEWRRSQTDGAVVNSMRMLLVHCGDTSSAIDVNAVVGGAVNVASQLLSVDTLTDGNAY